MLLLTPLLALLLMLQALPAEPVRAAGVVSVCDETHLNTALTGGGSVTFNCGASPVTITVTGQKVIGVNTTIDGGGLVTLSGGGTTGVFHVNLGIALSLQNITVTNGNGVGGGVNNEGTLTLLNSTFSNNNGPIGGGVYNAGTGVVNVTSSTFYSNTAISGGGVYNVDGGRLNLTNSTFISNTASAGFGGGVDSNGGTQNISNTTFVNNFAFLQGGGIVVSGTASINNSTLSNNNVSSIIGSGGGAYVGGGNATLTNSTLYSNGAQNGGGIYTAGALTVTNGTIDSNSAPTGGDISGNVTLRNTIVSNGISGGNCSGTVTDGGGNLQWAGSVSLSCGGSIGTGNPTLGPLQNNGGATQTMAIAVPGPASGHGPANCPPTDQRGAPRGATCDSGAYQHQTPAQTGPSFIVTRTDDGDSGTCAVSFCSLREAVNAANAAATDDTITFSVGGTIVLGSSLPNILDASTAGELVIDGTGQNITVSGNNAVRVMYVNGSATLTLQNVTIANGSASPNNIPHNGGGVFVESSARLTVTNSTFSGNTGQFAGGVANDGVVTVMNSTFSGNRASAGTGGGIYNSGAGVLYVSDSTFYNNYADSGGGGILNDHFLDMTNSTFYSNTARVGGGAGIYNEDNITCPSCVANLWNTIIAHNSGVNCAGVFSDGGGNLQFGDSSCGAFTTADPKLGPLAINGGPTLTLALLTGSAAISLATAHCPATDQRGFVRRGAPNSCDSGAYQLDGALRLFMPLITK